jgi:hypothetical protein
MSRRIDRRAVVAVGLLVGAAVIVAVVVIALTPSRPATRYEVFGWSVAVPDDLGLETIGRDAAVIWAEGPGILLDRSDPPRALSIRVQPYEARGSDADTVLAALADLLERADADGTKPVTRVYPAGAGASVHAKDAEREVDVVYLYHEGQLVTFVGTRLSIAEIESIATTFRFRVPPGDPSRPASLPALQSSAD